jgi:hypothetical protein
MAAQCNKYQLTPQTLRPGRTGVLYIDRLPGGVITLRAAGLINAIQAGIAATKTTPSGRDD